MTDDEHEAYVAIRENTRKFPAIAVSAVMAGVTASLADVQARLSVKDGAMLAAMALADAKRMSKECRHDLNEVVRRGINPINASLAERAWLKEDQ